MGKYNKRIVKRILDLLKADSYTIAEICNLVHINQDTYYYWRNHYPEFAEAVEKTLDERKQFFVVEAKKSLLKKLQGYTVQEKHTTMSENKEGKPKIKEQKVIDKHFQPDTAAIIFTLCNNDPDNWKNRQVNEVTGKGGKDLFANTTDEELDARIALLESKLNK
jgi:hypothetical protein